MSMTKQEARDSLEKLADRYQRQLQEERIEEEVVHEDQTPYSEEPDGPALTNLPVINLASIPVDAWGALRVSKVSTFSDIKWDWRQEGSPLYRDRTSLNWDMKLADDVPLISETHAPLVTLLRALLFYWTPQNALFVNVRSFNSTFIAGKSLSYLGHFLTTQGAYVDLHGNGKFKVANDIDPESFKSYCGMLTSASHKLWFVRHVRYWWQLSQSGLLPPQFQLGSVVFDSDALSSAYKEHDEAKTPYQPITLETLSSLIPRCFEVIENHAEDILFAYELIWPTMLEAKADSPVFDWDAALLKLEQHQTLTWNMGQLVDPNQRMSQTIAYELCREIRRHPAWKASPHYSQRALYGTPREKLKEIAFGLGIDLRKFNRAIYYDVSKVRNAISNMATTLRNACAVIILLVTGMRRSELANLEAGSYWKSHSESGGYRLRFLVFKTSHASQGEEHEIPIPAIAYKALCCMERLSAHSREAGGHNLLFSNVTANFFGKPINISAVNKFLDRWCEDLGLEESIHPHQFRKTLAMFLIYQDAGNLPLIKRLFGHKSLKMSLAYITKLPGIAKEVKLALLKQNMELMSELLDAADKGKIGGRAGSRLKETVGSGTYAAMLNDGGWETLEQYVDSVLDEGLALLHRAAMGVICTKTPAVDQPAPCDAPFAPKIRRLHPNVQNCQPLNCKWAAFTETSVPWLRNEIKAHRTWLNHPYASAGQKQFSAQIIESCLFILSELGLAEDDGHIAADSNEKVA
jgi:integrase